MKPKQVRINNAATKDRLVRQDEDVVKDIYDVATPLWNKYYKDVRKSIRFPRYYKRSLNW